MNMPDHARVGHFHWERLHIKTTACEERSFFVEFFVRIFVFVLFLPLYTFFAQRLPLYYDVKMLMSMTFLKNFQVIFAAIFEHYIWCREPCGDAGEGRALEWTECK